MMKKAHDEDDNDDELELLGQGAYGCAFSPEINCRTGALGKRDRVTKIQYVSDFKRRALALREIELGKRIQRLVPQFRYMFAPILDSCPLRVETLQKSRLEKCKVVEKAKAETAHPEFMSNTLINVGRWTLTDYFTHVMQDKQFCVASFGKGCSALMLHFLRQYTSSLMYMLQSLDVLYTKAGILHLDLKYNNVLHDEVNDVPILIDFGLSAAKTWLDPANKEEGWFTQQLPFGIVVDAYWPWCMEVVLLAHVARAVALKDGKRNAQGGYVDLVKVETKMPDDFVAMLRNACDTFVDKSEDLHIESLFTGSDREDLKVRLKAWVDAYVAGKTFKQAWMALNASQAGWDTYACALMYLGELNDAWILDVYQVRPVVVPKKKEEEEEKDLTTTSFIKMLSNLVGLGETAAVTNSTFVARLVEVLKKIALAAPTQRPAALDVYRLVHTLFHKLTDKAVVGKPKEDFLGTDRLRDIGARKAARQGWKSSKLPE
jgi:hypothetical protein